MERKMKIAMVASCPFPANHGTPGAIRELSLFLVKQGHEVHVVTYPEYEEGLDTQGLIIHRVRAPFKRGNEIKIGPTKSRLVYDFLLIPKLVQVIRKHKIDIVHTHNYEAAMAGGFARLFTWCPMVYNGINSMADELPSYDVLKPKVFFTALGKFLDFSVPRAASAIMVLSDELKHYLVEDMRINQKRVFVIPPGVNTRLFDHGDGAKVRSDLGIAPETPLILYTGAIEGFQRVDLLIEAMGIVAQKHASATLLIAGNVPNEKAKVELLRRAEALGFAKRIVMVDNVSLDQLPHYLDSANVTVSPRVTCPGYPIKLLNYMAAGKAIVSFEGSAKAICHGYNGYVAKGADVEDFATGILTVISDPVLAETLGKRARETIQGNFDWDAIALGTAKIYEQIVENGKVDAEKLRGLVKKSYIPEFEENGGDGFLRHGTIRFPQYE